VTNPGKRGGPRKFLEDRGPKERKRRKGGKAGRKERDEHRKN